MDTHYGLPLNLPVGASAHADQLDNLNALVHWFMLVLFVGWGIFFVYSLFRFRKGRNPVAAYEGAKGHFSTYGEAAVVLVEVVLLIVFAVPIWAARVGTVPDEDQAVKFRVVAEQFAWNAQYPGADGVFGRTDPKLITAGINPLGLRPERSRGQGRRRHAQPAPPAGQPEAPDQPEQQGRDPRLRPAPDAGEAGRDPGPDHPDLVRADDGDSSGEFAAGLRRHEDLLGDRLRAALRHDALPHARLLSDPRRGRLREVAVGERSEGRGGGCGEHVGAGLVPAREGVNPSPTFCLVPAPCSTSAIFPP